MLLAFWRWLWPQEASRTQRGSRRDLSEIMDRLDDIERRFKSIEIEWTDTFEKFSTLHARLAKRAQKVAPEAEVEQGNPYAAMLARGRSLYGRS